MLSIGVVVVTYEARNVLEKCLAPLRSSPLRPEILVVNSSSSDGTVEEAHRLGVAVWIIPRGSFDHGATREAARRRLGTDIVVMLTPDAHACDAGFLERLVEPLIDGRAAVSYARQIPRADADPIERFSREFNYPAESQLRGIEDWQRYGSYTHFCSNSCAAWRNRALDLIGGFKRTLVSEETVAVAELLELGERVAYVAEAHVVHSHASGILSDFRRQFDVGYARAAFRDKLLAREADERRGVRYARALLAHLRAHAPLWIPYALVHMAGRYLGYRLGMLGRWLPRAVSALSSNQDFFWRRGDDGPRAPLETA